MAQTWSVKAGLRYGLNDEEAQSEAANAEGHASVWAPKGVGCGCKMGGCGGWIFLFFFSVVLICFDRFLEGLELEFFLMLMLVCQKHSTYKIYQVQ